MITDSFDIASEAIISPPKRERRPRADVCIITFSHEIERYAAESFADGEIASLVCATGAFRRRSHPDAGRRRSKGISKNLACLCGQARFCSHIGF